MLGTSALFSTAYGNVGSSIYYALGLVASYALGLTPIVFLIAGAIFYLTAATYAEATVAVGIALVALSALPVHKDPGGGYTTLLGTTEAHGGFAGDPVLGIVKHLHLGPLQSAGEIYVGILAVASACDARGRW
jgi:hypothetical protein